MDMTIPLDLWFCADAKYALLNEFIANTQRKILITFESMYSLVQAIIPDPSDPASFISTPLPFTELIITATLNVNNLFVNSEVYDIFAKRITSSLIRVHKVQKIRCNDTKSKILLSQLKYPTEYITCGIRDASIKTDFDRWWLMGSLTTKPNTSKILIPAVIWNTTLGVTELIIREARDVSSLTPILQSLAVKSHGDIVLYPELPSRFYNSYLPTQYLSQTSVISPVDNSVFLINFCLYPGRFSPSGYYNMSADRELYIHYTKRADAPVECEMVVTTKALNLLIRKGDQVMLQSIT
jgi:hypothetical protein